MEADVVMFAAEAARAVSRQFPGSDWYLFGSSVHNPEHARDIDLLIVHDDTIDATGLRGALADLCRSLPIHLTILTQSEEKELDFVGRVEIYRKLALVDA
jgi:hypothetical protein